MIRDFRQFDGQDDIECDVCIAGAGAAGISIALALADQRHKVVLLEAGGFDYSEADQDAYVGRNTGRPYHEIATTRLRFLGGSTNHWGGMCSHLEPIDFEKRAWIPYSGWPISFDDLEPWYKRAHPWLELGRFDYRREVISPVGTAYLDFDESKVRHKMWHFSRPPTNFGIEHRERLNSAPTLDVLLNASLVDIETDEPGSTIRRFLVQSLDGKRAKIQARQFVLALGGLENPRVLLNTARDRLTGVGNERGLVGRFFMEHLNADAGQIATGDHDWAGAYDSLYRHDRQYRAFLTPSRAEQSTKQILGSAIGLGPLFHARERSVAYESLHKIKMAWLRRRMPDNLGKHISNLLTDTDGLKEAIKERLDSTIYLYTEAEQAPNLDSRVLLGNETDAFGLRRLQLDWRLSEIDKRSIRQLAILVGEEVGRLGKGRVGLPHWLLRDDVADDDPLVGGYHHMGTTRMASDPSTGVVNADCQIFGTNNLFVAGSSVFSTGGAANPTLTIVALALRLANHLDQRLSMFNQAGRS
ncbi:MAG: FAD-dependent oxidoreductase [Geminicoccaceae bacterium]